MLGRIFLRKGLDSRYKFCLGDNIMLFYKGFIYGIIIVDIYL